MSSLIEQNTPEWLEMRKDHIGASDAPVIMQVSPYATPYELWLEKLSIKEKEDNWGMEQGRIKEPIARAELEKQTGLMFMPTVRFHPQYKWMMASLDAIDLEEKYIAEIKCPGLEDHSIAEAGKVPEKYFPQIQHQLEVTGLEMAYYFSFHASVGVLVKVPRDDKYIKNMIEKEQEFYECVQQLNPPKITDRDYVEVTDESWLNTAMKWKLINQQLKALEEQEKELRQGLISNSPHANCMGAGIKVSKTIRKGNIDYSKITELKNVDLEQYRKPSAEYWKILTF
jgi:putative phage-type endonuclease